jgi:hypothetical protein
MKYGSRATRSRSGSEMQAQLIIIESEEAYTVAWSDNPQDWIVSFRKGAELPAREWAERMVSIFNQGTPSISGDVLIDPRSTIHE